MSAPGGFDYEAAVWGTDTIAPGERTIASFRLEEALRFVPNGARLLELGCGAGRFLRAIERSRPDLRLAGADVSRRALALARARSPGLDLRLIESSSARVPASDGEFDVVLLLDVLEHVPDPRAVLDEAHRLLGPGGVLHAHVPCEGDPLSLWRWIPGQAGPQGLKRRLAGHVTRFRRRELLELVRGAGFDLLRVRHSLHLAGNLADTLLFLGLNARNRRRTDGRLTTTSDVLSAAEGSSRPSAWVRAVDHALWLEARLLGRLPSWAVHVSARRR